MDITKETKLKELLADHPQIKEKLPEINPKFKMLNTPMGKVMLARINTADGDFESLSAAFFIHRERVRLQL